MSKFLIICVFMTPLSARAEWKRTQASLPVKAKGDRVSCVQTLARQLLDGTGFGALAIEPTVKWRTLVTRGWTWLPLFGFGSHLYTLTAKSGGETYRLSLAADYKAGACEVTERFYAPDPVTILPLSSFDLIDGRGKKVLTVGRDGAKVWIERLK